MKQIQGLGGNYRGPAFGANPQVSKLNEHFSNGTDDDRIRAIVRSEVSKQITDLIYMVVFFGGAYGAYTHYGWLGIAGAAVVGIGLLWYAAKRDEANPSKDRHLITMQAEDLARMHVVGRAQREGADIWRVEKDEWSKDRHVNLKNGPWWDDFWERAHEYAKQLEYAGPGARKKRLADAAKRERAALKEAQAVARREDVKLIFWISQAIERL